MLFRSGMPQDVPLEKLFSYDPPGDHGLWYLGWQRPCSCLGNLTDTLHISPHVADVAMKIVLAYLLVGSYGGLLCLWKLNRKSI